MISAEEQLNAGPSSKKDPIAFPQTYEELLRVITILGNGAYGARRLQLMAEDSETFGRMKRLEQRLLTATGMGPVEDPLVPNDAQAVIDLFAIMKVPPSPQTEKLVVGSTVATERVAVDKLLERAAV